VTQNEVSTDRAIITRFKDFTYEKVNSAASLGNSQISAFEEAGERAKENTRIE